MEQMKQDLLNKPRRSSWIMMVATPSIPGKKVTLENFYDMMMSP